ncbi:MAG: hypothetical protein NT157_06830 [Candidatus Micrarchaeota archaeon]|nr:hypothetical protein [Candidatus Micrarchaeota archaeon]
MSSKFDDYLINEKKRRFLDTVKVASWTPPSGVVHTYAGREEPKPTKEKSRKVDKSRCNYHLCRKKRELENCPYCSGYYCEEHLMAIRPRMMNFESNSLDDIEARRNTEGHPCPAYAEMLIEKKKQETENYKRALDRLSGKSSSVSGYTKTEHHDDVKTPYYDDKVGGIEHKEGDSKLKAIFFVIFVITESLVFLYLWNSNQEEPAAVFPGNAYLNCSRIGHLTCSDTKPLYCKNGTVISLCQVCGCPAGFICDAD